MTALPLGDASPEAEFHALRVWGPRFDCALMFACSQHFGQVRKGNGSPYITHPLAVASIVGEYGGSEDQAIAALLHDLLEDCNVKAEDIALRFGQPVANIVLDCTDTTSHPKPPWRQRKEAYLKTLPSAPADSRLVITADKLHNAESIVRDLGRSSVGERVWSRFRVDRDEELWYFRTVCDALGQDWDHELLDELRRVVRRLG
jgi:(p)ppGpp synthase/HD superfamily hydrolase